MKALFFVALALAAPMSSASSADDGRTSCSVDVRALDTEGDAGSARRVSASRSLAVVFRGKVSKQEEDAAPQQLVFDVFNPRGHRYQVLLAEQRIVTAERDGHRVRRVSRTREASLAVAGSSIAWTSMYGKWRVEPRIEGESRPCGRPEYFTIRP